MNWKRFSRRDHCPICGGERHDCRQNLETNLIHCFSLDANPQDYIYRGQDSIGFGMWAHKADAEEWSQERREEWEREKEARRRERERVEQEKLKNLLTIPQRDQEIRSILSQLSLTDRHRQMLRQRGLTDSQIEEAGYRSVSKWQKLDIPVDNRLSGVNKLGNRLNNFTDGILIPIRDENGLYTLLRVNDLSPDTANKYYALSSAKRGVPIHLPNGEHPIAVYLPDKPYQINRIGFTEGLEYKPLLAAKKLGIPIIGVSGGNFANSKEAIKEAISFLKSEIRSSSLRCGAIAQKSEVESGEEEEFTFILLADGGSRINPHVTHNYSQLAEFIPNLKVADWGQLDSKDGLDIDELNSNQISSIKSLPFKEVFKIAKASSDLKLDDLFIKCLKSQVLGVAKPFIDFEPVNKSKKKTPKKIIHWQPGQHLPSPEKSEGLEPPIIKFKKGHRNQLINALKNSGWEYILDRSPTGLGKSHDAGLFENLQGKVWYLDLNHRNVSTETVRNNFTDVDPRHLGIFEDTPGRYELSGENQIKPSNCHNAELFLSLKNKNYNFEGDPTEKAPNPICEACIFHKMKLTESDGNSRDSSTDKTKDNQTSNKNNNTLKEAGTSVNNQTNNNDFNPDPNQPVNEVRSQKSEVRSGFDNEDNNNNNNNDNPTEKTTSNQTLKTTNNNPKAISLCAGSQGDGYGFRYQRSQALAASKTRLHPQQLASVQTTDNQTNYSNDAAFIEEASRTLELINITVTLQDFDSQLMDLYEKKPEFLTALQNLLHVRRYLTQEQQIEGYGLDHYRLKQILGQPPENLPEILDYLHQQLPQIKDLIEQPDSIRASDNGRKWANQQQAQTAQYARSILRREARDKTLTNIEKLPLNFLIDLLEIWSGKPGALQLTKSGEINISKPDYRVADILQQMGLTVLLDATGNKYTLAQKLQINPHQMIEIIEETNIYDNLTVVGVDVSGMGSNSWGDNALNRVAALKEKITELHQDVGFYTIKKYAKILGIDQYLFNHNRGSNADLGRSTIALFGKPYINIGAIMNEYICLFNPGFDESGKPIGWDEYYDEVVNAEIIQLLGRQRVHLYPDQQFTVYLCWTGMNLSFLQKMGIQVQYKSEYQLIPESAKRRQRDKWAIFNFTHQLMATGQKITQEAIAKGIGVTQGWVSKLFKGVETLTWKEFCQLFHSLYKETKESGIIKNDSLEVPYFRDWLELPPSEVASHLIQVIKDEGWSKMVEYLRQVCPLEAFQLLGILAYFVPDAELVWEEFLWPPPE